MLSSHCFQDNMQATSKSVHDPGPTGLSALSATPSCPEFTLWLTAWVPPTHQAAACHLPFLMPGIPTFSGFFCQVPCLLASFHCSLGESLCPVLSFRGFGFPGFHRRFNIMLLPSLISSVQSLEGQGSSCLSLCCLWYGITVSTRARETAQ